MNPLLAVALLPLHFTAPANAPAADSAGRMVASTVPVKAYLFYRWSGDGAPVATPGYADSTGRELLTPHKPGTRETVWVIPAEDGATTIYVMSVGITGSRSPLSNGCVIGHDPRAPLLGTRGGARTRLHVPVIRQPCERCGQAALAMVLHYYGATPAALNELGAAYDPVRHGSQFADLASAARRAGYAASVTTLTPDSLVDLLHAGVPPIVLYQNGADPITARRFGVVTGWDATNASFTVLDGSAGPREMRRDDLLKRWGTAGSQALIVRRMQP